MGHVGRSNESNQNGPWSTLLRLAGVFEFPQTEVVPDGLGLNRAVCVNTGDDSHYVLQVPVETFVFGSAFRTFLYAIYNDIELLAWLARILDLGISALLLSVLRLKWYVSGYLRGCFGVCLVRSSRGRQWGGG